jgi:ADP-ribose pyrophosphatase YjhB (NUDIX family)
MYRNHDWNDDYSYNSYSYSTGRNKLSDNKNVNVSQYCNNCGKFGHLFSNCIVPITSLGIIAFRKKIINGKEFNDTNIIDSNIIDSNIIDSNIIDSAATDSKNKFEYLMIQRVDSFGYVEFMRGKYSMHNYQYLKNIIDEMTIHEKQNILTKSFDDLWSSLWGEYSGIQYRGEEQISKNKYLQLKTGIEWGGMKYSLETLIQSSMTRWEVAEWGFPKGRRNHQEKDLECAFREFSEETGYDKQCLKLILNAIPYEEIFIGSNVKSYKNKYYLSYMDNNATQKNNYQKSEVKNMKWLSYDECMNTIRSYNIEKKNIITSINNTLHKFFICNI